MTDGFETTLLYDEHLLLGASMAELWDTELLVPMGYPDSAVIAIGAGATLLCDLSGLPYALLSGSEAREVAEMTFAGKTLSVGESAFESVFFGDGTLVGVPFVMRTGEHEYCMLDLTASSDACVEWALALTLFEQGGSRIFPGTSLEDATDFLVPFMLWGADAKAVLGDYLNGSGTLPLPGVVKSLNLDRIPVLAAGVEGLQDAFIVLVPTAAARILWRSLLSFPSVSPAGHADIARELKAHLGWQGILDGSAKASVSSLSAHNLVRSDGQFVGMRGLLEG